MTAYLMGLSLDATESLDVLEAVHLARCVIPKAICETVFQDGDQEVSSASIRKRLRIHGNYVPSFTNVQGVVPQRC